MNETLSSLHSELERFPPGKDRMTPPCQFESVNTIGKNGLAHFEIISDQNGEPVEYHCSYCNAEFQRLTGDQCKVGYTVPRHPHQSGEPILHLDLRNYLNITARTGNPVLNEQYSPTTDTWFLLVIFSDCPGKVTALIYEIPRKSSGRMSIGMADEKFRQVLDHANEAIFIIQERRLCYYNRKTLEITGFSDKELQQISISRLIHLDDRNRVFDMMTKRYYGHKGDCIAPFRVIVNENKHIWVEAHTVLIDWEGKSALINFVNDVTDRENAAAQLKEVQSNFVKAIERKTKEINIQQTRNAYWHKLASVSELATGIAHELNQPLAIIRAQGELIQLSAQKEGCDDSELKEGMQAIIEEVDRAAGIIDALRALSWNRQADPIPVNINDVLKESRLFFQKQLDAELISCEVILDPQVPETILDPRQLIQVIVNLVSNARFAVNQKAEEHKGGYPKRIRLRTIYTGLTGRISISVTDNGIGMSREVRRRCLEPFYTTREVGMGRGLGLAIVTGIVNQYQGDIHISSCKEEGTTVTTTFSLSRY